MPFTMPDFRPMRMEETSPWHNALQTAMGNYLKMNQLKYDEPMKKEELMKQQLYNQFYGPNIESQIGLRGAQTGLTKAQQGLVGAQTQAIPSQTQLRQAQANILQKKQQMLMDILSGKSLTPTQSYEAPSEANSYSGANDFNSNLMPSAIKNANISENENASESSNFQNASEMPEKPSMTYPQASVAMKMLGMQEPKIIDVNGQKLAITPWGNIEVAKGLSEKEKLLTKTDVKHIENLENIVLNSQPKIDTMNEISDLISNPEFEALRQNPILGKHELGWFAKFGTPKQQELVGNFKAYTGQIIKDSARDFGGTFRVGEQGLLNSMKPNDTDSLSAMKGKTEALTLMITGLKQRAEVQAQLMRDKGFKPLEASMAAEKIVNMKKIKEEIKNRLHPKPKKEWSHLSDEQLQQYARK